MGLIVKEDVKLYLNITTTDYDDLLNSLILRISAYIETYCGRTFAQATYTDEKYDAKEHNNGLLFLNQYPIASVTSLYEDTEYEFGSETLIDSDDYLIYADQGMIKLKSDKEFDEGYQNIKITYIAGYTSIPEDLKQACIEIVSEKYKLRGTEGKKSEKLGKWAATYGSVPKLSEENRATLDRYKNQRIIAI